MTPPAKKASPSLLSDILGENKEEEKTTTVQENHPNHIHDDTKSDRTLVGDVPDLPVGPDSDKDDVIVKVADSTQHKDSSVNDDFDGSSKRGNDGKPYVSPNVVALKSDKTPAEMSAETPDETAQRYNIDTSISDEDADNPRVQVYRDTLVNQVPSGTHLHPDVARDLQNRGIAEQHTDNAQVKRTVTEYHDFAPDAEFNDKFQAPVAEDNDVDDDPTLFDNDNTRSNRDSKF